MPTGSSCCILSSEQKEICQEVKGELPRILRESREAFRNSASPNSVKKAWEIYILRLRSLVKHARDLFLFPECGGSRDSP